MNFFSLQKLFLKKLLLLLLNISFAFLGCFQLSNYINFIVRPMMHHTGSETHTYKLKQQFSYTLVYMWVGRALVLIVELVEITSYISWSICVLDQQSLWVSLQSQVNFGTFQVQWMNREGEISKTKLMQIIMGLYYLAWCWMMRKDWSDYALLSQGN